MTVKLTYYTTTDSQAINWLTEQQTSTKTLKYLFTQCEPIHCRSIAPMQDTPSMKTTWTAFVTVKNPYVVKMSGNETAPVVDKVKGTTTYQFDSVIPVPSYLLAMAIGNLAYTRIGKRTGVIAEPGKDTLDRYVTELSELEDLLTAAETWLTPYIWG